MLAGGGQRDPEKVRTGRRWSPRLHRKVQRVHVVAARHPAKVRYVLRRRRRSGGHRSQDQGKSHQRIWLSKNSPMNYRWIGRWCRRFYRSSSTAFPATIAFWKWARSCTSRRLLRAVKLSAFKCKNYRRPSRASMMAFLAANGSYRQNAPGKTFYSDNFQDSFRFPRILFGLLKDF